MLPLQIDSLERLKQSLGNNFQDFAFNKSTVWSISSRAWETILKILLLKIHNLERLKQSLGNDFEDVAFKKATVWSVLGSAWGTS